MDEFINYVVKQKHKTNENKTKDKSQPNNAMNPNYVFIREKKFKYNTVYLPAFRKSNA